MINHEPPLPLTNNDLCVRKLIKQFRSTTLTLQDHARIDAWLKKSDGNALLFEEWIQERPTDLRPWQEVIGATAPAMVPASIVSADHGEEDWMAPRKGKGTNSKDQQWGVIKKATIALILLAILIGLVVLCFW